jgi:APA family basic amino acid/polyamine antiporter
VAIGATIGGGILRTPGDIAAKLPSLPLFFGMWIAGAGFAFLGATIFSELGAMHPNAGGLYPFGRRAFGNYAGFLVGYGDWFSQCGTVAALGLLIGEYLTALVPALYGRSGAVGLGIIGVFLISQWRGVRTGARIQEVTTALKALAMLLLIVACFVAPGQAPPPSSPVPLATTGLFVAVILAMQGVIFTYDSYYWTLYYGEELTDPGREIPRAMFGTVAAVAVIYLLLNIVFVRRLGLPAMAGDPFVAATAAQQVFGRHGDTIIRLIMIVSILGATNAMLLSSSRLVYSLSRDRLFPVRADQVNRGGTPTTALLLSGLVAVVFLLSGTFLEVLATVIYFSVANYAVSFLSLIRLRRTEPDAPRPYRAWGYPYTTYLALAICAVFLVGAVWSDPKHSLLALGVLALTVPAYWVLRRLTPADAPAESG